jgi:hypothetical protein
MSLVLDKVFDCLDMKGGPEEKFARENAYEAAQELLGRLEAAEDEIDKLRAALSDTESALIDVLGELTGSNAADRTNRRQVLRGRHTVRPALRRVLEIIDKALGE